MIYDYQGSLKKKAQEDKKYAAKLAALRKKRKKVVGEEMGTQIIGEIDLTRPVLGGEEYVRNFRVLRMVGLKWNLSGFLGKKASDGVVYSIGAKLGRDLVTQKVIGGKDTEKFLGNLSEFIKMMKIGITSVVEWDKEYPTVLRVDECISCSGMYNVGDHVCQYEGGIIGGVFSEYFKGLFSDKEVLCWGYGDETCQFEIRAK